MLHAILAAKPLVKWGVLIGAPVLILVTSHTTAYFSGKSEGKKEVRAEWDAALVEQAKEINNQILAVKAMEDRLAQEQRARELDQEAEQIKRKVENYAKSKSAIPLSREFVGLYDDVRRVSNQAGDRVPAADSGARASEVPRGEVRSSASQLVQIEGEDGEPVELTTDELYQAVLTAYEKLRLAKEDYSDFSYWNDGREAIELKRLAPD